MNHETLYVISVISNSARFQSRIRLYKEFEKHMLDSPNVKLITVEAAFGDRPFEVTNPDNPYHLRLRGQDELWLKEIMINRGVELLSRLHPDWENFAWIDSDIKFARSDWSIEALHLLQHFEVVQLWRHCIDQGPRHEIMQIHDSFMYLYHENNFQPPQSNGRFDYYGYNQKGRHYHSGYAWAGTRKFYDAVGGILDASHGCVLGSADWSMALGLIGKIDRSIPGNIHPNYRKHLMRWQQRSEENIKRDVGYMDSIITHSFHGKKRDRQYESRWQILTRNNFDPETDLVKDAHGMYKVNDRCPRSIRLRDELRRYAKSRNEDSIDL